MKSSKLESLFLFSIAIFNISWAYKLDPTLDNTTNSLPDGSGYRVVGGHDVNVQHGFMVSIEKNGVHICAGTIINGHTVLTAAHCFYTLTRSNTIVHAGDRTLTLINGAKYEVEGMFIHPLFDYEAKDYDMGLIRVKTPFTFGDRMQPIRLSRSVQAFTTGTIFGWGFTQPTGPLSEILQMADVRILSDATCRACYPGEITSSMFCAGYLQGGIDACNYDSGGPLIVNGQQVGITSLGQGCGKPNQPGVYTIVPEVLGWVAHFLMGRYNETIR